MDVHVAPSDIAGGKDAIEFGVIRDHQRLGRTVAHRAIGRAAIDQGVGRSLDGQSAGTEYGEVGIEVVEERHGLRPDRRALRRMIVAGEHDHLDSRVDRHHRGGAEGMGDDGDIGELGRHPTRHVNGSGAGAHDEDPPRFDQMHCGASDAFALCDEVAVTL